MTVEASHLRNGENADAAEGTGCNRKHLALCDVGTQPVVRRALQAVEGDGARNNVSLQGTLGHFLRQTSRHDELILHLTE